MKKIIIWILVAVGVVFLAAAGFVVYESQHAMMKKPAVYLYPVEDSWIEVSLSINGRITKDIPEYKGGWHIFVTKEGLINGNYDYLFYEAQLNKLSLPKEGWLVKYSDLEMWFDRKLPQLGLSEKEKRQFKEYWMSELPRANYYEIRLFDDNYLKENMDLIIVPEPDTVIRLDFYFRARQNPIYMQEPKIITPSRKGFTVVEWGGILA